MSLFPRRAASASAVGPARPRGRRGAGTHRPVAGAVLVHEWLGPLRASSAGQLLGTITVGHDVEVVLSPGARQGDVLARYVDACVDRLRAVLPEVPALVEQAARRAPAAWREHDAREPGPSLAERLYLTAIEVDDGRRDGAALRRRRPRPAGRPSRQPQHGRERHGRALSARAGPDRALGGDDAAPAGLGDRAGIVLPMDVSLPDRRLDVLASLDCLAAAPHRPC